MLSRILSLVNPKPPIPELTADSSMEEVFACARRRASHTAERQVVLVTPERSLLLLQCPPRGSVPEKNVAQMEEMIPPAPKRSIAVIGQTAITSRRWHGVARGGTEEFKAAARAIPFLGLMTGLAYIGHSVIVFAGAAAELPEGAKGADVLFVDSAVLPKLPSGWHQASSDVMRNPNIFVHDRETFQLRAVRKVGQSRNKIEFR